MSTSRRFHADRGASLLGLLIVLMVLGVMAAVAVSAVSTTAPQATTPNSSVTTTSTGESNIAAIQAALTATCIADYQTLSTAVQVYTTLHSANPPAGTSWATGIESGSSLIQSWPSDPGHFTFTWNGSALGVVPVRGTASRGSDGSAGAASGCYASMS